MSRPVDFQADAPDEVLRLQGLLEGLFVAVRTVQSYGPEHPLAVQSTRTLRGRLTDVAPPFSLQFVGQAFFKDRTLVPLPPRVYRLGRHMAELLSRLGLQELVFEGTVSAEGVLTFCAALAEADAGRRATLEGLTVAGMSWREIPAARYGIEVEEVDPEVFCSAQLALAIGDAEMLPGGNAAWSWARGMTVVRRLERAVQVSREGMGRALDVVPGDWTVARRSVAACTHALAALAALGVSGSTQRVAAHAALALAWSGLMPRGGGNFGEVAVRTSARLLEAPAMARTGVEPHRAKVSALMHLAAGTDLPDERPSPVSDLLRLVYELEKSRCPADAAFDLTLADLLAVALSDPPERLGSQWTRVLATAYGEIPPGARVVLPDGNAGIVLSASDAGALRPQVLVNGSVVVPEGPVRFLSPAETARAGGR